MLFRRVLILIFLAAFILTSCSSEPTPSPTPAMYDPGTPGVRPDVRILLPESIACDRVGTSNNCKYTFRIKFQELNGAGAFITGICLTYKDYNGKVWSEGGMDGCEKTRLVIQPGGMAEDRDRWVTGFIGGALMVRIGLISDSGMTSNITGSALFALPPWATSTPQK